MARRPDIAAALDRLAQAERQFLERRFLAPVLRGGPVQVRIAGVKCTLQIEPAEFAGWGIFQPLSYTAARVEREATISERQKYLELFPPVLLILGHRLRSGWTSVPAGEADARFATTELMPVFLVDGAELFDTVRARFDGSEFWFEKVDDRADPATAAYLREALVQMIDPSQIARAGLTLPHRFLYSALYAVRREARLADERSSAEYRLRAALEHGGADLRDFAEQGDVFSVTYEVDGVRHTSVVQKHDLTVSSAGICLSGQDQHFDLASLIGVLREGEADS